MNKTVNGYSVDIYQDSVFLEDKVNGTSGKLSPDEAYAIMTALGRAADKAVAWQMKQGK